MIEGYERFEYREGVLQGGEAAVVGVGDRDRDKDGDGDGDEDLRLAL